MLRDRILLVGVEVSVAHVLQSNLDVYYSTATNLLEATTAIGKQLPHIVVVQVFQQDTRFALIQELLRYDVPLVVYAADAVASRVLEQFPAIADVLSPTMPPSLLSQRLVALLQRTRNVDTFSRMRVDNVVIDFKTRQVWRDDQEVRLAQQEWHVLFVLASHAGLVVDYSLFSHVIWQDVVGVNIESLRVSVNKIRKALGINIVNERGRGYRFPVLVSNTTQPHSSSSLVTLLTPSTKYKTNLQAIPAGLTTLIGRDNDLDDLSGLLQQGVRLLTLLGPPGIGKTRLGQTLAATVAPSYSDGVFFIALEQIKDGDAVVVAIIETLRIEVNQWGATSPLELLRLYLAPRSILLVLDNFEQVVVYAPLVKELLEAAPQLQIIVTSRIQLELSFEYRYFVQPLAVSPATASLEQILASEAIKLFVQRARAVKHSFALTPSSAPVAAELCARLDGIPLAIELAAAQCATFTLIQIKRLLEKHLHALQVSYVDRSERQRSLQAAIDWSYDLLPLSARRLYTRLSVFAGVWSLEMAQYVCSDDDLDPNTITMALQVLQRHSLVFVENVHNDGDEVVWRMLETMRAYAREQLDTNDSAKYWLARHAAFWHGEGMRLADILQAQSSPSVLDYLDRYHTNLRAIITWGLMHDLVRAAETVANLWYFWLDRGHIWEGRSYVTELALHPEPLELPTRGMLLNAAGVYALWQNDYDGAGKLLQQSLSVRQQLGDFGRLADTLSNLAWWAQEQNELELARNYLQQSIELQRQYGDDTAVGDALTNLGAVEIDNGNYKVALDLFAESLQLYMAEQNIGGMAMALHNLGQLHRDLEQYTQAREHFQQSMALCEQLGTPDVIAGAMMNLAILDMLTNKDQHKAREDIAQSLLVYHRLGMRRQIIECLEALAHAFMHKQHPLQAIALLSCALRCRTQSKMRRTVADERRYSEVWAQLQQQVKPDAWQMVVLQGERLDLDGAVAMVTQLLDLRLSPELEKKLGSV